MAAGELAVESSSLDVDEHHRQGLIAISVLAFVSFFSSTLLFLYLSYKLVWHYYLRASSRTSPENQPRSFQHRVDFALGIDGIFAEQEDSDGKLAGGGGHSGGGSVSGGGVGRHPGAGRRPSSTRSDTVVEQQAPVPPLRKRQPPNQFLVLIFNLLLADMHQGVAFFLSAEWLRYGRVRVGTPTCFTQGLFVSTGDLASSCFITTIAIHTYLSLVRRYQLPNRILYMFIAGVWLFVYAISVIPILATMNGAQYGGFFVRAGPWCWMNIEYSNLRLLTHYLFIFIALALTSALYIAIFIHLRRETSKTIHPNPKGNGSSSMGGGSSISNHGSSSVTNANVTTFNLSHNPAFLIYPVIYVLCTLPLALGRIGSMAGADIPMGYMCFAGAMIASNGMFDCMLFGTTRNVIVFASKHEVDRRDTGLNTFNFMQTPSTRRYGNMVWVQGAGGNGAARRASKANEDKTAGGWWSWQRLGGGNKSDDDDTRRPSRTMRRPRQRGISQESLRGPGAIQMDTVTSVVVEVEQDKYKMDSDLRYPEPTSSVTSADKEDPRTL